MKNERRRIASAGLIVLMRNPVMVWANIETIVIKSLNWLSKFPQVQKVSSRLNSKNP